MVSDATEPLADLWRWFADTACGDYSPLYARITRAVADDERLLAWVQAAPPAAHLPPVLLAAVHYLLLDGLDHPLGDVYTGRSSADPAPLFLDLCRTERPALDALLQTRHTQTNDCGRSALIGPALTWVSERLQRPLALIDVGASAGLNLVCDRYLLDYGPHGSTGPVSSPVTVRCQIVGGSPPVADRLPPLVSRVGIDRSPVDVNAPDDARWLLACVWPDTGRLDRTAAAIALAQADPPTVLSGDALDTLPAVLDRTPGGSVAVVLTTWSYAYLSIDDRGRFVALLAERSRNRPVAWISADDPGVVDAFPAAEADAPPPSGILGASIFDAGNRFDELLALVHPHGQWLAWRAPAS